MLSCSGQTTSASSSRIHLAAADGCLDPGAAQPFTVKAGTSTGTPAWSPSGARRTPRPRSSAALAEHDVIDELGPDAVRSIAARAASAEREAEKSFSCPCNPHRGPGTPENENVRHQGSSGFRQGAGFARSVRQVLGVPEVRFASSVSARFGPQGSSEVR